MPIINNQHRIAYFPVPKVACTSLKNAFFELENGFTFRRFKINGDLIHIHNIRPAYYSALFQASWRQQYADYTKFLIVRDPVRRFLSSYTNRVIHYSELSSDQLQSGEIDLKADPDIHEFITHIKAYRKTSKSIRHHTQPIVSFAGEDTNFYDKIYDISELGRMAEDVSQIIGRPFTVGRLQTSDRSIDVNDLSAQEIKTIRNLYHRDYDVFSDYLS